MAEYKFTFRTLSPLHIGSGDEIDPFTYVIQEKSSKKDETAKNIIAEKYKKLPPNLKQIQESNKTYTLYYFDIYKLMDLLDNNTRIELLKRTNTISKANINPIRKYLKEIFNPEKHQMAILSSYTVNGDVYRQYLDNLNNEQLKNQLILSTVIRNKKYQPYIPGSSIKGAIRNAFFTTTELDSKVSISEDPFNLLKVSDSRRDTKCGVGIAFAQKFEKNKLSLYNDIYSMGEYVNQGTNFSVNIEYNNHLSNSTLDQKILKSMNENFNSYDNIINMLNNHYEKGFNNIYKMFEEKYGSKHPFIEQVNMIKSKIQRPHAFIQLGKYGGQDLKIDKMEKEIKSMTLFSKNHLKNNDSLQDKLRETDIVFPVGWIAVYEEK